MLTFSIETVTESVAQQYLDSQEFNRPVTQSNVRKYRNEINAGRWMLTGEALKFDTEGRMRDGQHRCLARIGASRDFETLVIRGIDASSQWSMDQGLQRGAGQQLAMAGVKDANVVGAGVRLYLTYSTGVMFRDRRLAAETITTPLIESWVFANRETVDAIGAYLTQVKAADAPGSVSYAAAIIFHGCNADLARDFFKIMATGAGGADHPITVLDKRLQRHRREGIRISSRDILGLYIQAWNAWIKARPLTKFQRPRGGSWTADTFPKPALSGSLRVAKGAA